MTPYMEEPNYKHFFMINKPIIKKYKKNNNFYESLDLYVNDNYEIQFVISIYDSNKKIIDSYVTQIDHLNCFSLVSLWGNESLNLKEDDCLYDYIPSKESQKWALKQIINLIGE